MLGYANWLGYSSVLGCLHIGKSKAGKMLSRCCCASVESWVSYTQHPGEKPDVLLQRRENNRACWPVSLTNQWVPSSVRWLILRNEGEKGQWVDSVDKGHLPPSPATWVQSPEPTWQKERSNSGKLFSDLHIYMHLLTCTHSRLLNVQGHRGWCLMYHVCRGV